MDLGLFLLGMTFLAHSLWAADEKKIRIVILDKEQHSVVPHALLKVYDEQRNPVEVVSLPGEFGIQLPETGTYFFDVSAVEYVPIRGAKLERPASGIIQILLVRRKAPDETQTVAFVAKDAYTGKPMAARFQVTDAEAKTTPTPTVTTAAHPEFGTELNMRKRYLLKVTAEDYEEYTASILIKEKEPEFIQPRVILLRPLVFEVSFTFRSGETMEFVNPERFQIRESGKEVAVRLEKDVGYAKLRVGKDYEIRVQLDGYELFEHFLEFRTPKTPIELTKTILLVKSSQTQAAAPELKPKKPNSAGKEKPTPIDTEGEFGEMAVGEAVRLKSVYFDQSSYILRPESYPQLDKLTRILKENPNLVIEIGGHTDNVGDARLNLYLSENRAKVISSYLVQNGIYEKQLRWKGYGQTKPIAPNDSEENKAQNRRVEIVVLEK